MRGVVRLLDQTRASRAFPAAVIEVGRCRGAIWQHATSRLTYDTDALPDESSLEETYYHRLHPAQGFAFQRVYTDDRSLDESMAVEDHDVVMVPRGYHPVVVPYGYESYYLNVMAGARREWSFKNDAAHEWMLKK